MQSLALLMALASSAVAASGELVFYWGQNSAGQANSQLSLGEYCEQGAGDIFVISFLAQFGNNQDLGLSISSCTDTFDGSTLLDCPSIGSDITKCQSLGKKVFLSLGGASGSYGLSSTDDADKLADQLWNTFGGGTTEDRPFGDAVIDGFDLDIEGASSDNYVELVTKLRSYFSSDSSRQYYISAAPQCPYPDAYLNNVFEGAQVDYAFIQFYNNPYCELTADGFNWKTWSNFVSNGAANKNMKLLVGLPGSTSAAGNGYVDSSVVKRTYDDINSDSHFGGIMVWDASQAYANKDNGQTFAAQLRSILDGGSAPAGSSSPVASTPVGSTPVASSPLGSTPVGSTPVASTPVTSTPLASSPLASTPLASTPLASTPLASTPLASTPLASTPLASTPLASTPLASTPLASTPLASTPLASTPLASTPLASTPLASTPLASTPLASTPAASTPAASTPAASAPAASAPASSAPAASLAEDASRTTVFSTSLVATTTSVVGTTTSTLAGAIAKEGIIAVAVNTSSESNVSSSSAASSIAVNSTAAPSVANISTPVTAAVNSTTAPSFANVSTPVTAAVNSTAAPSVANVSTPVTAAVTSSPRVANSTATGGSNNLTQALNSTLAGPVTAAVNSSPLASAVLSNTSSLPFYANASRTAIPSSVADGAVTNAPAGNGVVTNAPAGNGVVTNAPAGNGEVTNAPAGTGAVTDVPAVTGAATGIPAVTGSQAGAPVAPQNSEAGTPSQPTPETSEQIAPSHPASTGAAEVNGADNGAGAQIGEPGPVTLTTTASAPCTSGAEDDEEPVTMTTTICSTGSAGDEEPVTMTTTFVPPCTSSASSAVNSQAANSTVPSSAITGDAFGVRANALMVAVMVIGTIALI